MTFIYLFFWNKPKNPTQPKSSSLSKELNTCYWYILELLKISVLVIGKVSTLLMWTTVQMLAGVGSSLFIVLLYRAHLVPVFSFGENELFKQVANPKGSWLRNVQEKLQKIMGFALPLFHARGVFQYSFGLIPFRQPIHTVGKFLVPFLMLLQIFKNA